MVTSLGPGKFYGSSLPRPRIYTDIKFNSERVDPPASVMDPFYSWAEEAHWSMGGLSFKRLRLQGRIEGNVNRLRKQREKQAKERAVHSPKATVPAPGRVRVYGKGVKKERLRSESDSELGSPSPPPAPKITKRRRFTDLFDEESEEEAIVTLNKRRKPARKLVEDFEQVADQTPVGMRTRRRGVVEEAGNNGGGGDADLVMKVVEEVNKENSVEKKSKSRSKSSVESSPVSSTTRTSPRLSKKT